MLTIYGVYRSRASRNIWLLHELGLKFTLVPVIQGYRLTDALAADAPLSTTSAEFRQISLAGAIPVMEDDGLVLSESLAINLYLARKAGGLLAPQDASEDALMLQWALYGATSIESHALAILYVHADGRAASDGGRAEIGAHADTLRRPMAVLDAHLAEHGHMVGARFTVADINMAEIVRYAQAETAFLSEFPAVERWLKVCQSRPAFKTMWEARSAEPA
jgi:glutathione S-transferase